MKGEDSEGRSHIVDSAALIAVTSHPLGVRGDWSISAHSSRFQSYDNLGNYTWEEVFDVMTLSQQ